MEVIERKGLVTLCEETPLSSDSAILIEPTDHPRKFYVRLKIGDGVTAKPRRGRVRVKRHKPQSP